MLPGTTEYGKIAGSILLTDNSLNANYAVQTVPVEAYVDEHLIVGVANIVDANTGSQVLTPGDPLTITGWAAERYAGANIQSVSVELDNYGPHYCKTLTAATYGLPSPALAKKFNNPAYANDGWTVNVGPLGTGNHLLNVCVTDTSGFADNADLNPYRFTVGESEPPVGKVDKAVDATTNSTEVAANDALLITGWAADRTQGAPVSRVAVSINGQSVGNATLGIARPDVVAATGNNAWLHSGWSFTLKPSNLPTTTSRITVVVYDASGLSTTLPTLTVTGSSAPEDGPPFGAVYEAVDATTLSTTVAQGDNLLVKGWAADYHDGAPISQVEIEIDGSTVGSANQTFPWPQVASKFGSRYLNSGWQFTMSASGLATGSHTVRAIAHDNVGLSTVLGTELITVSP